MRSLKEHIYAAVDLSVVISIGIAFAGLMVMGYIIWNIYDMFIPTAYPGTSDTANASWNASYYNASRSLGNVTGGFDNAVNFLLIAITIFILAIAIAALLMLRGR
ncbi:MAG: hypothetical protein GF375_00530 [Candidatus Omnitrophica bacterium]|nr:hypothetical protein [Candidatus Omnitrophota bacterium]